MVRATVTKLLLLVILTFIICLPEFFRISTVNFFCHPYQRCEQRSQAMKGENIEVKPKDVCDPPLTADDEKWEQICTQKSQSNSTDPELWKVRDEPKVNWFMCETDTNMDEISASGLKMHFEVSVRLNDSEILTLTLTGSSNHSSLHLHPPEEEVDQASAGEGQMEIFYCCLPLLPTPKSANQSHCLLRLSNQTLLTGTMKEKLPWKRTDEWWCTLMVIWVALLGVVLLTVMTAVVRQIYLGKRRAKVLSTGYNFTNLQLNDVYRYRGRCGVGHKMQEDTRSSKVGERETDVTFKGTPHQPFGFQSWSRLTPIQEVDSPNEETQLDGNADRPLLLCKSASSWPSFHLRPHRGAGVVTKEQLEEHEFHLKA